MNNLLKFVGGMVLVVVIVMVRIWVAKDAYNILMPFYGFAKIGMLQTYVYCCVAGVLSGYIYHNHEQKEKEFSGFLSKAVVRLIFSSIFIMVSVRILAHFLR